MLNPAAGAGPSYPVNVISAGQAPGHSPGLQQINIQIPANVPAGVYELVFTTGSGASQAATQTGATLNITEPTAQ